MCPSEWLTCLFFLQCCCFLFSFTCQVWWKQKCNCLNSVHFLFPKKYTLKNTVCVYQIVVSLTLNWSNVSFEAKDQFMKQPLQHNPLLCCHILQYIQILGTLIIYLNAVKVRHTDAPMLPLLWHPPWSSVRSRLFFFFKLYFNRIGSYSSSCMCGGQKGGLCCRCNWGSFCGD